MSEEKLYHYVENNGVQVLREYKPKKELGPGEYLIGEKGPELRDKTVTIKLSGEQVSEKRLYMHSEDRKKSRRNLSEGVIALAQLPIVDTMTIDNSNPEELVVRYKLL